MRRFSVKRVNSFYIPGSMMKALLVVLNVISVFASRDDIRIEFMRAMDEVSNQKSLEFLQSKLRQHAIPRRSLADNADYSDVSIDLTTFAMKYVGCQNVKSFSDDLAQDKDSDTVLGYNRFVVFRLCPANKCSSYNKYGCQDSFGEYIIEMEMYLEVMSQYHYQKFLEYCSTCVACMNRPDDDTLYTEYNATTNETTDTWTAAGDCQYYDACRNYNQACKSYEANTDDNAFSSVVGCSKFESGDDVYFRGPNCGSNGKNITMALFKDNECTQYIDSSAAKGYDLSNDERNLLQFVFNPTCVSCINTNTFALYTDDNTASDVYEMCDILYEVSGKCNRYMNVQSSSATYSSSVQEEDEKRVCNFVESLMENTYDVTGEIHVRSASFNVTDWHTYQAVVSMVSPLQLFGLIASLALMLGLLSYSIYLYRKVKRLHASKSIYPTYMADEVVRSESGIYMTRTTSHGVYT